jgi:hypothetical protein
MQGAPAEHRPSGGPDSRTVSEHRGDVLARVTRRFVYTSGGAAGPGIAASETERSTRRLAPLLLTAVVIAAVIVSLPDLTAADRTNYRENSSLESSRWTRLAQKELGALMLRDVHSFLAQPGPIAFAHRSLP